MVISIGKTFLPDSVIVYLVIAKPPLSLKDKALHFNFTELAVTSSTLVADIANGTDCATNVVAVEAGESSP